MARARKGLTETEEASSTTVSIQVQALGASQIHLGRERLSPVSETLFGVMVRIVFAPGMQLSRAELLNMFWPGQPEVRQRGNLRQNLYKLRQIGVLMDVRGDSVRLNASQVVPTFSVARTPDAFRRSVLEAGEPLGPFLAGYVSRSPELNEWIAEVREVIHSDVRRVLVEELRGSRERVDWSYAERLCRWLLQFDPLNEDATLTLAECIALSGGKAQAVEVLDRYLEELGSDAGDIRLPAARLRHRLTDSGARRIPAASTERHFVGRTEELSDFTLALRRARWRDGSGHLLHGPPGMGKTRLTQELEKVAEIEGMLTLRYTCRESDSMRLLSVAMDMVSELLQAPGALGCAPETLRTLRRLVGQEPVPVTADGTPALREPLPAPAILRSAMVDLVAAVSDEKPVYLVLDDVHWMDLQSWEVFVDIIEQSETTRVCVLATSRVGHACATVPQRAARRLLVRELKRLTDAEATDLAERIAADLHFDVSGGMAEVIARAGEGMPLLVHALAVHRATGGSLNEVPSSIWDFLNKRLSSLSSQAIRLLQLVSLGAPPLTIAEIQGLMQITTGEVANLLDELSLHGAHLTSSGVLICHSLVVDAARNRLSQPVERMMRLQLVEVLIQRTEFESQPESRLAVVEQLFLAGLPESKLPIVADACAELLTNGAAYRSLQLLELGRERLPNSIFEASLLHLYLGALFEVGAYAQLLDVSETSLSKRQNDPTWDIENPTQAIQLILADLYEEVAPLEQVASRAIILASADQVSAVERLEAARIAIEACGNAPHPDIARRAFQVAQEIPVKDDAASFARLRITMYYHTVFGSIGEARDAAYEILKRINEAGTREAQVLVMTHIASCLRISGEIDHSREVFLTILDDAKELGLAGIYQRTLHRLALLNEETGGPRAYSWSRSFELEELGSQSDSTICARSAVFRARLLAAEGKGRQADELFRRTLAAQCFVVDAKRQSYFQGVRLAITRLVGSTAELRSELAVTTAVLTTMFHSGGQDYTMDQVLGSMHELGQPKSELFSLFETYMEKRLEKGPLAAFLAKSLTRLGFTLQPDWVASSGPDQIPE